MFAEPMVLRMLHGRPDRVGTEICVARNPNTLDDILRVLAAEPRGDPWHKYIQDSLKLNPRYEQVFGSHDRTSDAVVQKP